MTEEIIMYGKIKCTVCGERNVEFYNKDGNNIQKIEDLHHIHCHLCLKDILVLEKKKTDEEIVKEALKNREFVKVNDFLNSWFKWGSNEINFKVLLDLINDFNKIKNEENEKTN